MIADSETNWVNTATIKHICDEQPKSLRNELNEMFALYIPIPCYSREIVQIITISDYNKFDIPNLISFFEEVNFPRPRL